MYTTVLLPPAGKRQQQAVMVANAFSTPTGRLFITSLSAPAQTASTRFPSVKSIGSSTPTDNLFAEFPDLHAPRESSGQCATTRSQHNGIPCNVRYYIAPHRPTINRSTHRASPDTTPCRADPLTCSLARSHACPDNRLPRQTHSPATSPDLCATPDNQLPRTLTRLQLHRTTAQLRRLTTTAPSWQ